MLYWPDILVMGYAVFANGLSINNKYFEAKQGFVIIYLQGAATAYRDNMLVHRQNQMLHLIGVSICLCKTILAGRHSSTSSLKMKLSHFTLCALVGITITAKAQTKADTSLSNKPFVNWAKANAISLQDADKATGYADMQPIKKMIGNTRVVALGEASHGQHEPQAFRNRLFKFLVEQCGFTTIVMEAGIAETAESTEFVAAGSGDPKAGAKKMTMGDGSKENIELMQWMRAYNDNPAHKNKLSFYGMDMQIIGFPGDTNSRHAAIDITLKYLEKVDAASAGKAKSALTPYLGRMSMAKYPELSVSEQSQLTATLDGMIALITREQINYIAKSSKDEYEWAKRIAIAALQTNRLARLTAPGVSSTIPPDAWMQVNMRDASMAENLLWILNSRANRKVLIYSHNGHVKNAPGQGGVWDAFAQPPNMLGQYLRQALGKDLYIIGASNSPVIKTAQPGSIDLALTAVGKPRFIVDFKAAAAADPKIKEWLNVTRPIEANVYTFMTMKMGTAFDAMVFLSKGENGK